MARNVLLRDSSGSFKGGPIRNPAPQYPPDHEAAMRVPKGGSCCANCEYLGSDGASCTSSYFVRWNGSAKLPAPADEFCSDWWEPK